MPDSATNQRPSGPWMDLPELRSSDGPHFDREPADGPPSKSDDNGLDPLDLRILRELHRDVRQSTRGLARILNVAPGTVAERVHRMERRGVIAGYRLDLKPDRLGLGLSALIGVQLSQEQPLCEVIRRLLANPWIEACWMVTGSWDLVVLLHARDKKHLLATVQEVVWTIPSFKHSESLVILDQQTRPGSWLEGLAGKGAAPSHGGGCSARH